VCTWVVPFVFFNDILMTYEKKKQLLPISLSRRSPSISQETIPIETTLRTLKRIFCTNLPNSDVEKIKGKVAGKIEVDFEEEKDLYHVKVLLAIYLCILGSDSRCLLF
jgi:hypothetical protein